LCGVYLDKPGGDEVLLGKVHFLLANAAPLTADRIAAIRADPSALKSVRIELACKFCDAKCRAYSGIERSQEAEHEGWTWYEALPELYSCVCGKTIMSLVSIRKNLHGLLGHRSRMSTQVNYVPLYERSSLESIRHTFARLLNSTPKEEALQLFLEKNPILLHQFPATRLLSKPPILTMFKADFAVLTPNRELIVIELEGANTKLLRKNGDVAAPLSHAFDQVRNWLQEIDEHRSAILRTLGIEAGEVGLVRGVVIAGRDGGYDALHLRRLKGNDWGRIALFTYDDLLFALDALINKFEAL
jgi:hypothetical protein